MPRVLHAVWCDVDPQVEKEWESWMRNFHIPEVIKAGAFLGAKMYVLRDDGPANRVTIYEARDPAVLKDYLNGPSKKLREDYQSRFGSTSRLTRMVLEETFSF